MKGKHDGKIIKIGTDEYYLSPVISHGTELAGYLLKPVDEFKDHNKTVKAKTEDEQDG